jgi:hypothetical protein
MWRREGRWGRGDEEVQKGRKAKYRIKGRGKWERREGKGEGRGGRRRRKNGEKREEGKKMKGEKNLQREEERAKPKGGKGRVGGEKGGGEASTALECGRKRYCILATRVNQFNHREKDIVKYLIV